MAIMTNNNNLNLKYRMIVYNVDNHKNQNNDSNLSNDIDEGDDNYIMTTRLMLISVQVLALQLLLRSVLKRAAARAEIKLSSMAPHRFDS